MLSRRQVLAGFSSVSTAGFAGCNDLLQAGDQEGEGDTIEIIVTNETAEIAQVGVRVEDNDGEALFSRVYRVEPGKTDQSAGIETSPAVVRVFTPAGAGATWEYIPDSDLNCDGQDVGIRLTTDRTIESWYGC